MSLFQDFLRRLLISKISFLLRLLLCHPDLFRREVQARRVGRVRLWRGGRKEDKGRLLMNPDALATTMRKQAATRHPTAACWGLGDSVCFIYLLFLLGRLRFLHFQRMLDCTVSNKWTELSDLILVLRLLSTSLSDCTAWHRLGWVSSLWSWEARPGIAGRFRSGAKWGRKAVSMAGLCAAVHGHTSEQNERASSAQGGDGELLEEEQQRGKLKTAGSQT